MIWDFIISRGSVNIQNNLGFIRRNIELNTNYEKFNHLQNCISVFLDNTNEDIPDMVRQILSKIITYSGPVDNDATNKILSEMICSLRFYDYDVFLIKRLDLVEDVPMEDGLSIAYLLENTDISHICEGNGREFDEETTGNFTNMTDAVMTWFVSGEISLQTDIAQLVYIEAKMNDYSNMKSRNMSVDFNASDVYDFLREQGRKPLLITNIVANEFEDIDLSASIIKSESKPVAEITENKTSEEDDFDVEL